MFSVQIATQSFASGLQYVGNVDQSSFSDRRAAEIEVWHAAKQHHFALCNSDTQQHTVAVYVSTTVLHSKRLFNPFSSKFQRRFSDNKERIYKYKPRNIDIK